MKITEHSPQASILQTAVGNPRQVASEHRFSLHSTIGSSLAHTSEGKMVMISNSTTISMSISGITEEFGILGEYMQKWVGSAPKFRGLGFECVWGF